MRPDLKYLIRERFHGHEAPVDPGTWSAIQAKLTALPGNDAVEDLFRERFQEHGVDVDPGLWDKISGQLGHGVPAATTATGASSNLLGWVAGVIGITALSAGIYLAVSNADADEPIAQVQEVVLPKPDQGSPKTPEASITILDQAEPAEAQEGTEPVAEVIISETTPPEAAHKSTLSAPATAKPTTLEPKAILDKAVDLENASLLTTTANTVDDVAVIPVQEAQSVQPAVSAPDGPKVVNEIIGQLTQKADEEIRTNTERQEMEPESTRKEAEISNVEVTSAPLPPLFLPNTFSPNNDGVNDDYTITANGYQRLTISIFSINDGQVVFRTNDPKQAWNGQDCPRGECPEGYYLVAVEAVTEDGRPTSRSQVVMLIR